MAWELIETLTDSAGVVWVVCADENYLYVGLQDGSIYVYNKSDFSLETTLSASGKTVHEVYVDSDYIYVGTNRSDNYRITYIYNKPDFSLKTTLAGFINTTTRSICTDDLYIYIYI